MLSTLFAVCFLYATSFHNFGFLFANNNFFFARIKNANAYLYSSPTLLPDNSNQIFILPETYFVKVFAKEDEYFYSVSYMDKSGYAKKTDLAFVEGSPQVPFADTRTFRVFIPNGLALRSSPTSQKGPLNFITNLPFLENNFILYGEVQGEEAVPYRGNTWYYCNYITSDDQKNGYCYAGLCDLVTPFTLNSEVLPEIDEPNFVTQPPTNPTIIQNKIDALPTTTKVVIITLCTLPCFALVYFIFKPSRLSENPTADKPRKIKKLKKSDYYELE